MGAASSTSRVETDIVNEIITNILMESSQGCEISASTNQKINISNILGVGCNVNISDISQQASITQNFDCVNNNENSTELQNKLKSELDAKVEALTTGQVIGVAASDAEALTNLKNKVLLNVNMNNISSCVSSALSKQTVDINGVTAVYCKTGDSLSIKNIKQTITLGQVIKCINTNKQTTEAITEFENKVKVVAKAKTEGINLSLLGGLSSGLLSCCLVVLLIIVLMTFQTVKDPGVQNLAIQGGQAYLNAQN